MTTPIRRLAAAALSFAVVMACAVPVAAAGPLSQRCTNAEERFRVSYPSDWFTNQPSTIDGTLVDTCTLFAPFDDIEVLPEAVNVPIFLKVEHGSLPDDGAPTTIDGRPGVIVETEVNGTQWYVYYAQLDVDTRFAAFAFDNGTAPFGESRVVLDAMVATVDFDGFDAAPDTEPLVFELTLSGGVDSDHTFGLAHGCDDTNECQFIHELSIFCSGDEQQREDWGYPMCDAGTYTLEFQREAGVTVDYALLRGTGSGDYERHLADSVTVPAGGLTLRLGYTYSSAAPTPALPDTAVAEPRPTVPFGLTLVTAAAMLLMCLSTARSRHRDRSTG